MKGQEALFSHKSDYWKTPSKIYNEWVNEKGYFDPYPENPQFNGLEIRWKRKNFVNPPYSQIGKWVNKALEERNKGNTIYLLVPARTDTKWFHKILEDCKKNAFWTIHYYKGRLHFNDGKDGAPFPSIGILLFGSLRDYLQYLKTLREYNSETNLEQPEKETPEQDD